MLNFGYVANALCTLALIPQIKKTLATGSVEDMSYTWLAMSVVANLLWIVYAIRQHKGGQILFMGAVFTSFYGFLIYTKISSNKKKTGSAKHFRD